MSDITNVNLLFLRKARGAAPLSRFAAGDEGALIVAVPDEMEVRTFHLARYDTRGRFQIALTYNVETLRKTEIAADGSAAIGTTDDDLYVFGGGRKGRFLPDRRAAYNDIALGADGQRFAASFSDMLGSGFSVALGEISGRLLWTKDIAYPVSRVAVSRDAGFIAVGGETGDLTLWDKTRQSVWLHRQEAPIAAVATIGPQRTVFAGGGGVGAVDEGGRLLWWTQMDGEPIEIALTGDGQTTAVLLQMDETTGRLVFLSAEGLPTWDTDFDEAKPTGLSLSPSGCYAAVSLKDGSLALFELTFGERMASLNAEQALAEARGAEEQGNFHAAADLLRARLHAVPSDVAACEALRATLAAWKARAITAAENAAALGDFAEAEAHLADAAHALPPDADLAARRASLAKRRAEEARASAKAAQSGEAAERFLLAAIDADPLDSAARAALAEARHAAAEAALTDGREKLNRGDFGGAIAAFMEAQSRGASGPPIGELLRAARAADALSQGNALYQARQYAAALFQFKKVLRLDPDNAEARQKTLYAQNFLGDKELNDRFTRLE